MQRINYGQLTKLAQEHQAEMTRGRDEDGAWVHISNCFATSRDSFLREVDRLWPGKYHREYTGAMTVYLRVW